MTNSTSLPDRVVAAAERATQQSGETLRIVIRDPLDAQSNSLYDLFAGDCHLIVKEYLKPEEHDDAPARECGALLRLAEHDIAPQAVFYDPALGPIVIYEFMDGQMWDRRVPAPAELEQLAALWLRLHGLPVDGLWLSRGQEQTAAAAGEMVERSYHRYLDWARAEYPAGREFSRFVPMLLGQFQNSLDQLTRAEPLLCFGRADARFANVISRPGGQLGLIDWEDSGLRDPARDLGDLLTHPNQEDLIDMAGWQSFLAPYLCERKRVDPTIGERLDLYLKAFPVFWLAVLVNSGVVRALAGSVEAWQINDLPKNMQLRRYLARALAWPGQDFEDTLVKLSDVTFFPSRDQ